MILLNTRPKNLSKKINTLCNLEKIELQNIHLSEIISIHINNNSQPYKEIFQNLNKYSNFIFTSQAAVENGARFIKLKSKLYRSRNELLDSKRKQRFLQIVVGVLMLISGLIVISYRNKKRHSEQIAIINEQENQIAQVELKNKEAELVNLSTFALSKNDMLVNIVKDLDYHATLLPTKEYQKSLKPLKKTIQNFIDDGLNWEDYKVQFTNVYPNFVDSLISFNKEISNNDIKLCCYLKMNMNTKDIAQLFGLTVRAIENKRYRLRKKLKLETETSLMTFINGLN